MNKHSVRKFMAALSLMMGTGFVLTVGAQAQPASTEAPATTPISPVDDSADQTVKLEKFVVTGSNIPNAGEALAIPVAVVTAKQIQDSGVDTNVLDVLRKVSPAITGIGGENATTSSAATNGGSQATIHNLPTLVLIDGRRVAYNPADSANGLEFVDLNLIPLAAIDRIEILQDGSSAIYGADAVGGVINLILKKDFNGWQIDAHYGRSSNTGHYSERSGSLVGGVSDGKTSVTASVQYAQSDPIFESTRPYSNPFYATTYFPGIIEVYNFAGVLSSGIGDEFYQLKAGANAPPGGGTYTIQQLVAMGVYTDLGEAQTPGVLASVENQFNLAARETLQQSSKRQSATINVDHKIFRDNLVSFGDLIYSHVNTQSGLNAQPLFPYISTPSGNSDNFFYGVTPPAAGTQYVPSSVAANPFDAAALDAGHSDGSGGSGVLVHNRFIQFPRIFQDDNSLLRIVGGLKGQINDDWSWEIAADLNTNIDHYTNLNVLDTANLIAGFAGGTINPFAIAQTPTALTGVLGTAFVNMYSTLNSYDATVRGVLFELPAGKVYFSLGADLTRQNLTAIPDANTADKGWVDSPTVLPFNRNRTIDSVYGEVEVPLVDKSHPLPGVYALTLDGAGRYDNYTGVGSSTVPKVSLKYQPFNDQITLRASAGKSFIAPQLYSLYGPTTQGSSNLISYTTSGGTPISNVQFQAAGGANPLLKPSKASTWSVGFVLTPKALDGLTVTFDYYDVVEHGVVGTVDQATVIQSVENLGSASPYGGLIHFGTPTGPIPTSTAPGQISSRPLSSIYIVTPLINLGAQAVKGFDASVDYVLPRREYGKFEFTSTISVYNSYLLQVLPSENYYQYAGHLGTNQDLTPNQGGTTPRYRTYSTIEWKRRGWDLEVAHIFVPSVTSIGPGGVAATAPIPVASYSQFDVSAAYAFGSAGWNHWLNGLTVRVGVNDVFNAMPPIAPSGQENTTSDIGAYTGAISRMYFTDLSYKF